MKRLALSAAAVLMLGAVTAAPAAARPPYGCPAAASGYVRVDIDGWWDRSVTGWAEAAHLRSTTVAGTAPPSTHGRRAWASRTARPLKRSCAGRSGT